MHTSVAVVSAHVKISTSTSTFGDVKTPRENTARIQPTAAAIIPRLKLPAMSSFSPRGLDSFQTTVQGNTAKKTSSATVPTKAISESVIPDCHPTKVQWTTRNQLTRKYQKEWCLIYTGASTTKAPRGIDWLTCNPRNNTLY